MKRLMQTWVRRRGTTRMLVFRVDRSRRIDRVIDYFGERLEPIVLGDAVKPHPLPLLLPAACARKKAGSCYAREDSSGATWEATSASSLPLQVLQHKPPSLAPVEAATGRAMEGHRYVVD
jgi:hypothetical protein